MTQHERMQVTRHLDVSFTVQNHADVLFHFTGERFGDDSRQFRNELFGSLFLRLNTSETFSINFCPTRLTSTLMSGCSFSTMALSTQPKTSSSTCSRIVPESNWALSSLPSIGTVTTRWKKTKRETSVSMSAMLCDKSQMFLSLFSSMFSTSSIMTH